MEKIKRFNFNECEKSISQNNWQEALEHVRSTIGRQIINSQSANLNDLKDAIKYVRCDFLTEIKGQTLFLLELFRILRNFSTIPSNQIFLANSPSLLDEVKSILQKLNRQNDFELLTKVILQFLVNLIVSNSETSSKVAQSLYDEIFECFQKRKNNYEVIALLYNLHLQNRNLPFSKPFYRDILLLLHEDNCEYTQFLAELFIYDENFWRNYKELETSNRIVTLELMKTLWIERKLNDIPEIAMQILSQNFSKSDNVIFQTLSVDTESLEPYEVSLLLDILGCLCGDEKYLKILQKNKELVIRSGVILINVHRLGKQSENYFTSVQKLSELKEPNEVMQKHPAFGFKVGLVRLIGNLCWKNKGIQDLVKEAEIIPVLLDCCNIDARNPLIMQWVIFAVRNLCENNPENQALIAGLHKQGTISSALVEEMGLTLNDDDSGRIRIVPLDFKK